MTRFTPPPGVFVPTHLLFHPQLPAAVLVTWIQLRSLGSDGYGTPPLSLPELASRLGIHPARLDRHMAALRDLSALSWHAASQGKLILSFPAEPIPDQGEPSMLQEQASQPVLVSVHPEPPAPVSYFPDRILGYLSFDDDDKDPLYVEPDVDLSSCQNSPETRQFSKILTRKPVVHAFVAK